MTVRVWGAWSLMLALASVYALMGCTTKVHAPVTAPPAPTVFVMPDSIETIFTRDNGSGSPTCSCHLSANPPNGLNLSPESSFALLVDHPSVDCDNNLVRVRPGNPDSSCLMLHLDGRAQPQMPLGGPPLAAADTLKIWRWIKNGAPGTALATIVAFR